MKEKEKIVQIYEILADKALERIERVGVDDYAFELVRTTQSLYETINCTNQPNVTIASESSVSEIGSKSQYGYNYTDRPDVK